MTIDQNEILYLAIRLLSSATYKFHVLNTLKMATNNSISAIIVAFVMFL